MLQAIYRLLKIQWHLLPATQLIPELSPWDLVVMSFITCSFKSYGSSIKCLDSWSDIIWSQNVSTRNNPFLQRNLQVSWEFVWAGLVQAGDLVRPPVPWVSVPHCPHPAVLLQISFPVLFHSNSLSCTVSRRVCLLLIRMARGLWMSFKWESGESQLEKQCSKCASPNK